MVNRPLRTTYLGLALACLAGVAACSMPRLFAAPVDELPLFVGQLAPSARIMVADMEASQVMSGETVVVPKPSQPLIPASHVRAHRAAKERPADAVALQWNDAWLAAMRIELEKPLDLRAFVDDEIQRRQPQTRVLLLAIFPRDERPGTPLRRLNDRVNEIIAGHADGRRVFFLNINERLMNADGTLSKDILPDLLHLSEKGYARWAEAIGPTLQKLLAMP